MKKIGSLLFLWLLFGALSNSLSATNDHSGKLKKEEITKFGKISGRVTDRNGNAIQNVGICVFGHPDIGTRTKPDGRFFFDVPKNKEFGLCINHLCYCGKNILIKPKQIKGELNVVLDEDVLHVDFRNEQINSNNCEKPKKMPVLDLNLAEESEVLIVIERPEFPGGIINFFKVFKQEKQNVLERRRASGQDLKGTYHGTFVVDKTGYISKVMLDEETKIEHEAIEEIFTRMGKWRPGIQLGNPVDVKYSFIAKF